jgi:hypothetical protein
MAFQKQPDWHHVILAVTLVCGMIGGLLAAGISAILWEVGLWTQTLMVISGTVMGTGIAFFVLTTDRPNVGPRRPEVDWSVPTGQADFDDGLTQQRRPGVTAESGVRHPASPPVFSGRSPVPYAAPPAEPAKVVLPLPREDAASASRSSPRQWWTEQQPTNAVTSAAGQSNRREGSPRKRTPAPPLSSYDAGSALIAQCPRCGEFRMDVHNTSAGYAFRCARCGNTWGWTPGTPWPPVVVRRRLPGDSVPDGASAEQA